MAPEQAADAHAVDIRADVFSLGCTLYALLTVRAPFPGGSLALKIAAPRHPEPPPLKRRRPDPPPAPDAVVPRMIVHRPEPRPAGRRPGGPSVRCRVFTGQKPQVNGVALARDGRVALSGSPDRTGRLWDAKTGEQLHAFDTPKGVWGIALSADGKYGLSAEG